MNGLTDDEVEFERAKLYAQATKQKSQMVRLLDSPDWKAYAKLLQVQIDRRLVELLSMPKSGDDIVAKTYTMGELAGIKLALDYPQVLIGYAEANIELEVFRQNQEKENGEISSTSKRSNGDTGGTEPELDLGDGDRDDDTEHRGAP